MIFTQNGCKVDVTALANEKADEYPMANKYPLSDVTRIEATLRKEGESFGS